MRKIIIVAVAAIGGLLVGRLGAQPSPRYIALTAAECSARPQNPRVKADPCGVKEIVLLLNADGSVGWSR